MLNLYISVNILKYFKNILLYCIINIIMSYNCEIKIYTSHMFKRTY